MSVAVGHGQKLVKNIVVLTIPSFVKFVIVLLNTAKITLELLARTPLHIETLEGDFQDSHL